MDASANSVPTRTTIATVQRLLAAVTDGELQVHSTQVLARRRSLVWRLRFADGSEPPAVIVKQVRDDTPTPYDPDADNPEGPAALLFNEWAALTFLNSIPSVQPLTPRLLGGDRGSGLLVLEDLGDGPSLADLLLAADPVAAVSGLEAYAAALGRLQAVTAGRFAQFLQLRQGLGPGTGRGVVTFGPGRLLRAFAEFIALAAEFAVEAPTAVQAEGAAIAAHLNAPGEFDTFSPSDACPDNNRYCASRITLFDFEGAGYQHALLDGAYLRLAWPTCWCVAGLPSALPDRLEAIYRSELSRGCPAAADAATFRLAMLAACAAWLVWSTNRIVPRVREQDLVCGPATGRRQVSARLRLFAAMAAEGAWLEHLGRLANRFAAALERAWPEEVEGLPFYPTFATSEQRLPRPGLRQTTLKISGSCANPPHARCPAEASKRGSPPLRRSLVPSDQQQWYGSNNVYEET